MYGLKQAEYNQELNTIHNILHNNAFPIRSHKPPTYSLKNPTEPRTTKKKWASFTYAGRETSYITNLFKKTELNVALCNKNTIGNLLVHRYPAPGKFSLSGVYKLPCPDCNRAYIGLGGSSPPDSKNTKKPSEATVILPASRNTVTRKPTPLDTCMTSCKYYITAEKEPT